MSWGSGRGGRPWRRKREAILVRDCGLCQPCKRKGLITAAVEVDHIRNKARGGTDDDANLESICSECHEAKTLREAGGTARIKVTIGADGWPK